jgi:hypothetical protein
MTIMMNYKMAGFRAGLLSLGLYKIADEAAPEQPKEESSIKKYVLPGAAALAALGGAYGAHKLMTTPNNAGTALGGSPSLGYRALNSIKNMLGLPGDAFNLRGSTGAHASQLSTDLGLGHPGSGTQVGGAGSHGLPIGGPTLPSATDLIPKRNPDSTKLLPGALADFLANQSGGGTALNTPTELGATELAATHLIPKRRG